MQARLTVEVGGCGLKKLLKLENAQNTGAFLVTFFHPLSIRLRLVLLFIILLPTELSNTLKTTDWLRDLRGLVIVEGDTLGRALEVLLIALIIIILTLVLGGSLSSELSGLGSKRSGLLEGSRVERGEEGISEAEAVKVVRPLASV